MEVAHRAAQQLAQPIRRTILTIEHLTEQVVRGLRRRLGGHRAISSRAGERIWSNMP